MAETVSLLRDSFERISLEALEQKGNETLQSVAISLSVEYFSFFILFDDVSVVY